MNNVIIQMLSGMTPITRRGSWTVWSCRPHGPSVSRVFWIVHCCIASPPLLTNCTLGCIVFSHHLIQSSQNVLFGLTLRAFAVDFKVGVSLPQEFFTQPFPVFFVAYRDTARDIHRGDNGMLECDSTILIVMNILAFPASTIRKYDKDLPAGRYPH